VAVASVQYGNAGCEIDKAAAFGVPDEAVFGTLGKEVAQHPHTTRSGSETAGVKIGILGHDGFLLLKTSPPEDADKNSAGIATRTVITVVVNWRRRTTSWRLLDVVIRI
jgi:hypothetical protein